MKTASKVCGLSTPAIGINILEKVLATRMNEWQMFQHVSPSPAVHVQRPLSSSSSPAELPLSKTQHVYVVIFTNSKWHEYFKMNYILYMLRNIINKYCQQFVIIYEVWQWFSVTNSWHYNSDMLRFNKIYNKLEHYNDKVLCHCPLLNLYYVVL